MKRAFLVGLVVGLVAAGCDGGGGDTDAGTSPMDAGPGVDGGMTGGDGGAGTDGGGGADGATPMPDAGFEPSCDMGTIRIQQTCPTFTPCGGDVVGEWCYADICITKDELLSEVIATPGVPTSCTVDLIQIRSSMGTISGTVSASATSISRMVTTSATGKFYLPAECLIATCRTTEAAITAALGTAGSATCIREDPGCECDITFNSSVDDTNTYTLDGNTIVLDTGRRFDYCVEGDGALRFREDDATGIEPGVQLTLPVTP